MNILSDDIQNEIYKLKHNLELKSVINELNEIVDYWCDEQLQALYSKSRPSHTSQYKYFSNELKHLNDYEEHLFFNLKSNDILNIINDKE